MAFVPLILSGGAGARLWPISREALPKPFIALSDGETLLLKTMRRAAALASVSRLLAVTNRDHYFLTRDEYEALGAGAPALDFLLEPVVPQYRARPLRRGARNRAARRGRLRDAGPAGRSPDP
jgi:mannose-1-phosphate guanylyltransferase